jgi:hypothetical protein
MSAMHLKAPAAPFKSDYEIKNLVLDDQNVDPSDWVFQSALRDKVEYKLMSREPLDHFDYKHRYLVKQ